MDGGFNFTDVTGSLPVNFVSISSICIDPTNANRVWVTFSGYSSNDKVYRTDDGGVTWNNQSVALPNLPCNALIYQEGTAGVLYLGTDVGVYWWNPNTLTWDIYGVNLPNVIVSDIDIQYSQGLLRVATFGRGIWEIPMAPLTTPTAAFSVATTSYCQGASVSFDNLSSFADSYQWFFEGGNPAISTANNPIVSYSSPGTFNVKLVAANSIGTDTIEYLNYITIVGSQLPTKTLGNATNLYTNLLNKTNPIVVDNSLNTVVFVHRQNTGEYAGTDGMLRYDYSINDGQTWSLNTGVLNPNATAGEDDARYPQINIYNPTGNTNPTNARLLYLAPTTASTWNGYVSGDGLFNSSSFSENYNQPTGTNTLIPGNLVQGANGVYWSLDAIRDGTTYQGLRLLKGLWNGTSIVWSVQNSFYPDFNLNYDGTPQMSSNFSIAFSPNGQIGYIVFLSHLNGPNTDFQYYPIFYKTVNGGTTWTGPIEIDLSSFPSIANNLAIGTAAATAFDIDLTVDVNGNPHALFNVCSGPNVDYTIYPGEWMGACHLHFNGVAWEADILDQIQTLRYTLNDGLTMDNTPQVSRSDDGKIIAFAWSDSDPTLTGIDNSLPFLKIRSYNVISDTYSAVESADICSLDPGQITFMHCANSLLETTQGYEIATVVSVVNESGSGADETGHKYFSYPIPNVCPAIPLISSVSDACVGENVSIINNSTNTQGYSYSWDVNDDGTIDYTTTGSIQHTYSNPGYNQVNLLLNNGNGCLASASIEIVVHETPDLNLQYATSACVNEEIVFTNNSTALAPFSNSWDFNGDGTVDSNSPGNPVFTYASIGSYIGLLSVTDGNGCSSSVNFPVTIQPYPNLAIISAATACGSYNLGPIAGSNLSGNQAYYSNWPSLGGTEITTPITSSQQVYVFDKNGSCGDSIQFQVTINEVASGTDVQQACNSYTWINGVTYTSTNTSATYTFSGGASNGCDSIVTLNLTINPNLTVNTSQSGITLTAVQNSANYQWLDCLNNFGEIDQATNQSYTATVNGSYAVVISTNGCIDTSACYTINSVEMEDLSASISIRPNPTNDDVIISLGANLLGMAYVINDNAGRIVYKGTFQSLKQHLDLSSCASGMYYLQTAGYSKTHKIIKLE
jgi:PKD repeat protein